MNLDPREKKVFNAIRFPYTAADLAIKPELKEVQNARALVTPARLRKITGFHGKTLTRPLKRLMKRGLVKRKQVGNGVAYCLEPEPRMVDQAIKFTTEKLPDDTWYVAKFKRRGIRGQDWLFIGPEDGT